MLVPNTSATGGYINQTTGPMEGVSFRRFIGSVLVAVSGLPAEYVRPSWQIDPPPIPSISTNWLAFGQAGRRVDYSSYQRMLANGEKIEQQTHEECDFLLVFYGPDCLDIAARVRDGFRIIQNQEALNLQGMAMVGDSDVIHVPELINDRYYDRADMTITIRRELRREYQILSFLGSDGTISANDSGSRILTVDF
jgi:hypothetical protein